tara:strand:+ start:341 stop:493 length:153 start_codon:yes stop_codon:yes gene_type:complete
MMTERSRIIIIGSGTSWLANTPGGASITERIKKIAAENTIYMHYFLANLN